MNMFFGYRQIKLSLGACLALGLVVTPSFADEAETAKLLTAASTGSGQARYAAIDDLGERAADSAKVVPELVKMLGDSDPQVEWRSARALGDYGAESAAAVPELRALLTNEDPILQYHAAIALGKIGDKSDGTVDSLVNLVGSSDSRVSRAAVSALKNLKPGPVKIQQALKKAMLAEDRAVVIQAIDAIVEHGANAVPLLNECLKDPSTVYLAAAAAEQIGPDAAGAVPALIEVLDTTEHSHLEIRVLLALARIGPGAKQAVPTIVSILEKSQDATVPVAAAFALGSIGVTEADAPLRAAVAKDNPFLSMVAAWSLAKIHPEDALLKQQALDKLNAGLKSDDPAIQAAAEKGLKLLETPAAAAAP